MKKMVAMAVSLLMVILFNSFADDSGMSTIDNIVIQPTLANGTSYSGFDGYVFVNLTNGKKFYIAPTEASYEIQVATLLTAKSRGASINVGIANGIGSVQGTNKIWGTITYYQIYYLTTY
jgi:hypothetical protein